ncbi:MAG: methylmalonyl-CoA mutase family protein [Candidatus Riflebacteria bacterium]|nr:methylmalonyl-CoA mutase family protein [Candidatus Riflebacteria bacterium]
MDEQRWSKEVYEPSKKKVPERREEFHTTSGIPVEPVFNPRHLAGAAYEEKLGYPGAYPFTRGVQPAMYRSRFWTMRQYAGFGTAEESNVRYRYLLSQGQTGLSVAFDLPTQIGYDADDELAHGEVGKVGVSISSLEDLEQLFHEIPLDRVSTSMTINATAPIILAMYVATAKKQSVSPKALNGTVQNDILKEYVARGTYRFPPKPSMRLITDLFRYCAAELPSWNTISISGYHMREAGCTAVQEVAFTLANGIEYVRAAIGAGLDVDRFASRLSFFFNSHNNLLEEVAKFRAARRMWAKIMRDRFKARDPRSWMLRFHTQTAGSTLTAQQPDNNVVRTTIQALAAVLGGTQSLHTNSRDEALALPSEPAVLLALRTQQVIAHESGATDTVDPLAGSYYVEALTDEIERRAWEYIEHMDKLGGALHAIEAGYVQREIQDAAFCWQRAVESQEQIVVGVNKFTTEASVPMDLLKVDPALRERQVQRLVQLRSRRNAGAAAEALDRLEKAARGDQNLMPLFVEAVEHHCTLGEICQVLARVFGEQREFLVA